MSECTCNNWEEMAKKYPELGKILKKLLFNRDMRPADLAREINLPPPTIHRLITGKSTRPYPSSLQPIADYFNIQVEQLLGESPLPGEPEVALTEQNRPPINSQLHEVPLIPWQQLSHLDLNKQYDTIPYLGQISKTGFASILCDTSMEPIFARDSLLVFDPTRSANDRSYVLVNLAESKTTVLRQLVVDGEQSYLKSLNPDLQGFQIRLLNEQDIIVGVLLECRTCFEKNTTESLSS